MDLTKRGRKNSSSFVKSVLPLEHGHITKKEFDYILKINLNDKWKKQKTNSRISSLGRIYESVN
jgi:hypothetical protein